MTAGTSLAQPIASTTAAGPRVLVAPYAWIAGISGEMRVRDLSADVDLSFGDLLSVLRFAAMGTVEVGYGPWAGIVDLMYTSVGDHRTRAADGSRELEMSMKLLITNVLAGYGIVVTPAVAIDVLGGMRIWAVESTLRVAGEAVSADRSRSPAWVDAVGGARVRWHAADRWHVAIGADAGGGGSKSTVGALASAAYDVSSRWTAFGGYRYLHLDRRRDDFAFDGGFRGPLLGAAYRW